MAVGFHPFILQMNNQESQKGEVTCSGFYGCVETRSSISQAQALSISYLQPICLLVQLRQARWAGVGLRLWVKVKGGVCSTPTLLTSEPCSLSAPGSETE